MRTSLPVFGMEWIWIALVGFVLLFGTKKLPEMAKTIGKAMGELQRGRMEIEKEIQVASQPIQEVAEDIKEAQHDIQKIQGEVTNTQRNVLAPLNLNKKRSETVNTSETGQVESVEQDLEEGKGRGRKVSDERIRLETAAKSLGIDTPGKSLPQIRKEIKTSVEGSK